MKNEEMKNDEWRNERENNNEVMKKSKWKWIMKKMKKRK